MNLLTAAVICGMPLSILLHKIPLGRIQLTEVEFSFIQVMTQRSNSNVGYCYTLVLYLLEEDKLLLFNLIKSCVPSTGKSSYSHPIAGNVLVSPDQFDTPSNPKTGSRVATL